MPCIKVESSYAVVATTAPTYDTISGCAEGSNAQGNYIWVDTALDQQTGSFDIATAQTLIGYALVAFAVAYTFRMLRDMILNRR
jgi:hypothetical protein